jgi:hypothetical protein
MPLEIRQLLLDAEIAQGRNDDGLDDERDEDDDCCEAGGERERLKQDILAECKLWMLEQLQLMRER